jgi:hypothetical protein
MSLLRKYATAVTVGLQMPKAGSADYAAGGDWIPAAGDVQISIDGGASANITALPVYANGWWLYSFTAAEMTGGTIRVKIQDTAPKAIDDQAFVIETYGNALALHTLAEFVTALFNTVIGGGVTFVQAIRGIASFAFGLCSGGGTGTVRFRDLGDTKDAIVATVDTNGNRSVIIKDLTS